jgi:hypothetical protein
MASNVSIKADIGLDGEVTGLSIAGGTGRPLYLDSLEAAQLLSQLAWLMHVRLAPKFSEAEYSESAEDPKAYAAS